MASIQALSKFLSKWQLQMFDHDPGATTAIITSADGGTTKKVVDMSVYSHLVVGVKPNIVGGTGLTLLEIIAADDAAMSVNVHVVKTQTVAADALADYVLDECSAEEIGHASAVLGYSSRYAAARLTMGTATDEATVIYIALPRFANDDESATLIN